MRRRNIPRLSKNYSGKRYARIPKDISLPVCALLLWLACYALPRMLPNSTVSRFFLPISKALSLPVKIVTGLFPFSLLEAALLCFPIGCIVLFVIEGNRPDFKKKTPKRTESLSLVSAVILTVSVMMSAFHIMLGFGYNAVTLDRQLDLQPVQIDTEVLREAAQYVVDLSVESRALAEYSGKKVSYFGKQIRAAYRSLSEDYPFFGGYAASPKRAILSVAMSHLGIAGLYSPFTCEALINVDATPPSLPFTIAHEMAHSLQIARENEANFAAFLACMAAEDPAVRYSGYFSALLYLLPALRSSDPDGYPDFFGTIDDGIVQDIIEYSHHVAQYDGWINDLHSDINDFFLKSNGQSEGVRSYGMMVTLVVAWIATHAPDTSPHALSTR